MQRGTRHTDETRAKMSATRKGRALSAEHRAALTQAGRNRVHSQESNAKRSLAMRAYWATKRQPNEL